MSWIVREIKCFSEIFCNNWVIFLILHARYSRNTYVHIAKTRIKIWQLLKKLCFQEFSRKLASRLPPAAARRSSMLNYLPHSYLSICETPVKIWPLFRKFSFQEFSRKKRVVAYFGCGWSFHVLNSHHTPIYPMVKLPLKYDHHLKSWFFKNF
jgi:hypothetical protein